MLPVAEDLVERSCPARAAIAGNPSDGHGGAVVAIPLRSVRATTGVRRHDRFEFRPGDGVDVDARALVVATMSALRRHLGAEIMPLLVDVATTIPRSVGLAGSSAIVVATAGALAAAHSGARWADVIETEPDLLASIALAAERDELGIEAGLQDRVVQTYDNAVLMDFAPAAARRLRGLEAGTYRRVADVPATLFVATRPASASSSAVVHRQLADRRDHAGVRRSMQRLGDQARRAARAIDGHDVAELGAAMDASFDLRRSIIDLDAAHVEMIEIARAAGAHANYSGSGGAITVLGTDDDATERARAALEDASCSILAI